MIKGKHKTIVSYYYNSRLQTGTGLAVVVTKLNSGNDDLSLLEKEKTIKKTVKTVNKSKN